ncbi:MAG: hypothetical protein ACR2M4_05840 [Actinomycetota bacterium]
MFTIIVDKKLGILEYHLSLLCKLRRQTGDLVIRRVNLSIQLCQRRIIVALRGFHFLRRRVKRG